MIFGKDKVTNKDSRTWAPLRWLGRATKGGRPDYGRDAASAWAETFNPLRNLTIPRAAAIYDNARMGLYAELQWLYQEIESADPTIFTCVERRSSALMETDYAIKSVDAGKARGYDESLAEDQRGFLKLAFADAENGNLNEAIEHLGLGFFRGFSHVRPLYARDFRTLEGFQLLDNWNFCRDIHSGDWYWNPRASLTVGGDDVKKVPPGELVTLTRDRHVDYPALQIFIRRALGEKKYGQFIERYGLPPVIITMPPDIDKNREDEYLEASERVALGGSGAVPNGSTVNYATEARGTDPFQAFFDHQQRQIVLMATGGILTSLSSTTGIGQGASDAHSETWRTIIRRDCKLMTTPFNRVVVKTLLEAAFPGRPQLAYFDFADPRPTAADVFENAAKAKTAGYVVRRENLEEMTGYELEADTQNAPAPSFSPYAPAMNKADPLQTPLQAIAKREEAPPGGKDTPGADPSLDALLTAFAADMAPAAERVAALLSLPEGERPAAAGKLIGDLPSLMPADPEAAAAIAQALAETFAETINDEP